MEDILYYDALEAFPVDFYGASLLAFHNLLKPTEAYKSSFLLM